MAVYSHSKILHKKPRSVLMEFDIKCSKCGQSSPSLLNFKCPSCSEPLTVQQTTKFKISQIHKNDYGVWRYRDFFQYVNESDIVTLGEGWTPLVRFSNKVHFKLESLNPTGSFKDRGSAVLISAIHKSIKEAGGYISEDSSGNAGASVAAYAARAGLKAKIFVPQNVSGLKLIQTRCYGAEVTKVSGDRSDVAAEAQKAEKGKFYVGHILHPLFRDGIRSLAYEIVEQSGWVVPKRIYLPVSAGTLLLGMISGFQHLIKSRLIKEMPEIVACQTRQVSPLYHAFKDLTYSPPEIVISIADALVSVNPPLLGLMSKELKAADGNVVIVEEEEITRAHEELSASGFLVEPSSAVAYAGYKKQLSTGEAPKVETAVVVLTGTGLKTALRPAMY